MTQQVNWKQVKVAVFSPDSQNTPTRLRIDQVPLSIKGISGERVTYVAKGTSKTATTHVKNLTVADSDTQAVDRTKYSAMQVKFKIKKTDIFRTPLVFFMYLSAMLGYSTVDVFDPCPAEDRGYDGLLINWGSPAFMNPPFSRTYEWMAKAMQQALAGVEVICLISTENYFCVESVERLAFWKKLFTLCHVELLSHDKHVAGTVQKWFKWGVNEVTGEDTGGPGRFGIVCFRLTKGDGESVRFVTDEAAKVIADYRVSRTRKKKVTVDQALNIVAERDQQIAELLNAMKLKDELIALHEQGSPMDLRLTQVTCDVATLSVLDQEEKESGVNTPPAEVAAALSQTRSGYSDGTPTFTELLPQAGDLDEDSGSNGREWESEYSGNDDEEQFQAAELLRVDELEATKAAELLRVDELEATKAALEQRVLELERLAAQRQLK
jgi:hypothetical protein